MRIPIREQLGLLVLLCSLVALGVIAVATVTFIYLPRAQSTDRPPSGSPIITSWSASGYQVFLLQPRCTPSNLRQTLLC